MIVQLKKSSVPVNLKTGIFFAFLLTLPTQLGFHFWPDFSSVLGVRIDYLSPTVYLSDIFAIALISLFLKFNQKKFFWIWFFQLFLFLLATSLLLAQNQGAALYKLFKIVELILFGVVLYQSKIINSSLLRTGLSLVIIYTSLLGFAQFIKGSSLGFWILGERSFTLTTPGIATFQIAGEEFLRPYATFSHPNSLSGFILVSLLLLLPLQSKLEKTSIVFGLAILFLAWSQVAWVCVLLFVLYLFLRKRLKSFNKIGMALAFILSLSPILLSQATNSQEVQVRKVLLESTLKMFQQNALLGVGLNNFIPQLPEFLSSREIWRLQPAHNIYMLVLVELGIIGSGLLFLGARFVKLKQLFRSPAIWAILLTGSLDHYWFTLQQNQLLLVIVCASLLKAKSR